MIVPVLLPLPFDGPFSYSFHGDNLPAGSIVKVPFRTQTQLGVVWPSSHLCSISTNKIKPISEVYEVKPFSATLIEFISWVATYNLASVGSVLKMALPAYSKARLPRMALPGDQPTHKATIQLSGQQAALVTKILAERPGRSKPILLEGVPGAGKTEVYLAVAEQLISNGQQVLILLPEIVLATQLIQRFRTKLPHINIVEWHSRVSSSLKHKAWHQISCGSAQLIVGARSALFLPFNALGLIVVDEEHDTSFKQEEGVIYNARDMAVVRAQLEHSQLILCSATPSLESVLNAKLNKYEHHFLNQRFSGVVQPKVIAVDLKQHRPGRGKCISQPLQSAVAQTVAAGKQALLFLNRRGYAPFTLCQNCGDKVSCPHCSFWLVYHKKKDSWHCHYCSYQIKRVACTTCPDSDLITIGVGIERVEEEVRALFPQARIAIFTSDTANKPQEVGRILAEIAARKIDIILGTQMVAKGLHFSNLHLVGVVDADIGLGGSDLRALERMHQMLQQVAGRAGREQEQGIVLLQSYEWQRTLASLMQGDSMQVLAQELQDRKLAKMPPFTRLVMLRATSHDENTLLGFMQELAKHAPECCEDIDILGPSPAPKLLLRGKYRYRIILRAAKCIKVQPLVRAWLAKLPVPRGINVKVDVDPYSFF